MLKISKYLSSYEKLMLFCADTFKQNRRTVQLTPNQKFCTPFLKLFDHVHQKWLSVYEYIDAILSSESSKEMATFVCNDLESANELLKSQIQYQRHMLFSIEDYYFLEVMHIIHLLINSNIKKTKY